MLRVCLHSLCAACGAHPSACKQLYGTGGSQLPGAHTVSASDTVTTRACFGACVQAAAWRPGGDGAVCGGGGAGGCLCGSPQKAPPAGPAATTQRCKQQSSRQQQLAQQRQQPRLAGRGLTALQTLHAAQREDVEHGMQPRLWLAATAAVSVLRSTSIMPALGPSKSAAYHAVSDWGSVGPAVADSCKALYRIQQPLET